MIETLEDVRSLADFARRIRDLPGPDLEAGDAAAAREGTLTKPAGALGRLEEVVGWLARWQGRHPPRLDRPLAAVFAGNHGVVARGVSAYPGEVTLQMVANYRAGGAAINQICREFGAELQVVELALDRPTRDFTEAPAMAEEECAAALAAGWNAVSADTDLLIVGEMGIGNTTSSAALCAALFGGRGGDWVGPGTGVDAAGLQRKAAAVDAALDHHGSTLADPLEALRRVGGRELAAIAGAVAAARTRRVPVLLDGFVTSAAAAVLFKCNPEALDHCLVGHVSAEPGHRRLLERLGQRPLLQLDMRLGEGSGAAVALGVLRAALAAHTGMATFADAGVSGKL